MVSTDSYRLLAWLLQPKYWSIETPNVAVISAGRWSTYPNVYKNHRVLKEAYTSLKWYTIHKSDHTTPGKSLCKFHNHPFNCLRLVAKGNKLWFEIWCIIPLKCHDPIWYDGMPISKLLFYGENDKYINKNKDKVPLYFIVHEKFHTIILGSGGYESAPNLTSFGRYGGNLIAFL